MRNRKVKFSIAVICVALFSGILVAQNHGVLSLLMTTIQSACTAGGGSIVGGHCWIWGAEGANCTDTCSGASLSYSTITRSYAGSDGTDANCAQVLTALTGTAVTEGDVSIGTTIDYKGCYSSGKKTAVRGQGATSEGSSSSPERRVCACN